MKKESDSHSVTSDSVTPRTLAHQAPLSMEFSRQVYWSGLPVPTPGDLPDPGIEARSAALQTDYLVSKPPGNNGSINYKKICMSTLSFLNSRIFTFHETFLKFKAHLKLGLSSRLPELLPKWFWELSAASAFQAGLPGQTVHNRGWQRTQALDSLLHPSPWFCLVTMIRWGHSKAVRNTLLHGQVLW